MKTNVNQRFFTIKKGFHTGRTGASGGGGGGGGGGLADGLTMDCFIIECCNI